MERDLLSGVKLDNKLRSIVQDSRLSDVYHHNYSFELPRYAKVDEWQARCKQLKEAILISAGLWPFPNKCELRTKIFDKQEFDGFTIEKVLFESYPGFYVTGNLYRPTHGEGPFPAILNPHGHWENGRLEMSEVAEVPTRCANFAKMGFIAFSYDMVGHLDSKQFDHEFSGLEHELWGVGLLGLQLWNSIRSIDFLQSLPDVDSDKIGCTGASGGATQTFLLGAVDERLKVSAPVSMVSSHMQGGCKCENAPYLRMDGTTNVEIAAMFAPRQMLITGNTGDWTKNIPNLEFPYIQHIYSLYGASEKTEYFYIKAEHNYNKATREAVYNWFRLHFHGLSTPWEEVKIDFGDLKRLRIFSSLEANEFQTDEEIIANIKQEKVEKLEAARSTGQREQMKMYDQALRRLMGLDATDASIQSIKPENIYYGEQLKHKDTEQIAIDQYVITAGAEHVNIPVSILKNKSVVNSNEAVLFIHPSGAQGLVEDPDSRKIVNDWLQKGYEVATADVFLTGAYLKPYSQSGRNATLDQYFTTYNYTDSVLRVQDIVHIYRFLQDCQYDKLHVVGLYEAGLWASAALPFLSKLDSASVDLNGFNLDSDEQYVNHFFVPHFRAIGGFETCFHLAEPRILKVFNCSPEVKDSINKLKTEVQMFESFADAFDLAVKANHNSSI
ncbi:alpha/beta hydrolase family protein [Lederbergia citrea]|uniref:alpha/beta hydrolase family protein n=1 Tax=Lederbergia citrea TaxID=2833581 RepID=UPI001BC9DF51|nr:CocE/NonD family hydrolase [Lederbergia citrea]MBS4205448.1 acetylxylan esterase [Lederbergia citrea]